MQYLHFPVIEGSSRVFHRAPFPIDVTIRHAIYATPSIRIQWQMQSPPLQRVTPVREPNDVPVPYFRLLIIHFVSLAGDFRCEGAKMTKNYFSVNVQTQLIHAKGDKTRLIIPFSGFFLLRAYVCGCCTHTLSPPSRSIITPTRE